MLHILLPAQTLQFIFDTSAVLSNFKILLFKKAIPLNDILFTYICLLGMRDCLIKCSCKLLTDEQNEESKCRYDKAIIVRDRFSS